MVTNIEFIYGNSFEEIYKALNFKNKEDFKELLSQNIIEPQKTSQFLEENSHKLESIFEKTLNICFQSLYLKDITIYIFPTSSKFIIESMDGISGFAPNKNNVFIFINPTVFNDIKNINMTISHEFNHTCFYDVHKWDTLLSSFVAEGLADVYSTEIFKTTIPNWSKKFTLIQLKNYWDNLKNNLIRTDLHHKVFFGFKNEFPTWLGYSVGFQIVSLFRQKHPNLTWLEIMRYKPSEILKLSDFENIINNKN